MQGDFKDPLINVEYISKKGKQIVDPNKITWGRKVRQAIETEKKRAPLKARQAERLQKGENNDPTMD